MGNYRFKLSDMIPNAWFYKLKDMRKTGKKQTKTTTPPSRQKKQLSSSRALTTTQSSKPKQPHQQCTPRKSYYFTRDLKSSKLSTTPHPNSPELPRKSSSKQRIKTRTPTRRSTCSPKLVSSTVSAGCSCRTTVESVWTKSDSPPECSSSPFDSSPESESPDPEFRTDRVLPTESSFDEMVSFSTSCACKTITRNSNTTSDVVIDVDKNSLPRKDDKLNNGYEHDAVSELDLVLELPPILTKPPKIPNNKSRMRVAKHEEEVKEKEQRNCVRRFSVSSPGVKLRVNSPRIGGLRVVSHGRKSLSLSSSSGARRSLSDSFAVVKSSFNPQKDFRESMVEMIVENNIRASKDLEDLLACYLSLNSDEYHDLIINVFKQIWVDLTETR